jgi:hypothetical protein
MPQNCKKVVKKWLIVLAIPAWAFLVNFSILSLFFGLLAKSSKIGQTNEY